MAVPDVPQAALELLIAPFLFWNQGQSGMPFSKFGESFGVRLNVVQEATVES